MKLGERKQDYCSIICSKVTGEEREGGRGEGRKGKRRKRDLDPCQC